MEEFDFYPTKPELAEAPPEKNKSGKTIFSIVLFAFSMLLIFSDQLSFIFLLIFVLLIHELGHYLVMKRYGYENVRLLFIPLMGAFVQGKKETYKQKESIFVVIAGPLPGVLIGSVLMYIGVAYTSNILIQSGAFFLFLNLINLLPIYPLDGGQLLKLLINKNHELFQLVFSLISSLLLIGIGFLIKNWIIVGFGFLMGVRVRSMQKSYQIHRDLKDENVNYETTYSDLSNKDFSIIKRTIFDYSPSLKVYSEQLNAEEIDPLIANQVNSLLVSPIQQDAKILLKIGVIILWVTAFIAPLIMISNFDPKAFADAFQF